MNRFCSMFSQILQLFSRSEFQLLVKETKAERHARGFNCWDQFVSMMFCQLGRAHSLREICQGLSSCEGKLSHLGIGAAPHRCSLAYANQHRPWELYQKLFFQLLERCHQETPFRKKFRFKNKLVSLDSTVIDLCVSVFDWAKFRRTKGAIKLHLLLDHDGYLPCFGVITEGKVHDVKVAWSLSFEPGTLVVEDRPVPHNRSVLKDQIVFFSGSAAWGKCPYPLRRVEVWNDEKQQTLVFLTNQFGFGASTIAAIYKERWQIELFFKALKQNLKIKTFVGTSANAVRIQIWTALIAVLILKILQFKSTLGWALSNLVALLRWNLFSYRDLWEWINRPFDTPPEAPAAQGELFDLDSILPSQT